MPRLSIRDQLRLGYLAVILVLLLPLVASIIYIGRTARVFAGSLEHNDLIVQAQELAVAAQYSAQDINAYALGHPEHRAEYTRHRQLFITALAQLEAIAAFLKPDQRALILHLGDLQEQYDAAAAAFFDRVDLNRETRSIVSESDEDIAWLLTDNLTGEMDEAITELVNGLQLLSQAEAQAIQQQIASASVLALFATVAAVGGAILISQWVSGHIVPPVMRLAVVARAVAAGDLTARAAISAHNEIGELGATFDLMTEQLSESIRALEQGLIEAHVAREQAEHAEKIKGAFLASMSHELRTPLNAIINFTRFVAEGDMGEVNAKQKELLGEVVVSGKHLLSLINDVLDMSKIEAGSLNLFIEENVSMADLLHNLTTITGGLIANKPVRLRTNFSDDLPAVRGDRQRLYQSLLNIAANAVKFTDEGEITIGAKTVGDTVEVAISDTGPGIPMQEQAAVFAAFKQTESGMRIGRGTGLGMPIAKSLIEAHGGGIRLDSSEGRGTTFTVVIPLKSAALTPAVSLAGRLA